MAPGGCEYCNTSRFLQKLPTTRPRDFHQKMNFTPAWNANGVLPGATCVTAPNAPGTVEFRTIVGREVSGVQLDPNAVELGYNVVHGVQFPV